MNIRKLQQGLKYRGRVEAGQVPGVDRQPAGDLHLAAAPVPGFGLIIKERERHPVQDFVGENRRLRGVPGEHGDAAGLDAVKQLAQPVDVHRLVQAVRHGLADQRMVRNLDLARQVLGARHLVGKHGGEQILSLHACDLRRDLFAAAKAR